MTEHKKIYTCQGIMEPNVITILENTLLIDLKDYQYKKVTNAIDRSKDICKLEIIGPDLSSIELGTTFLVNEPCYQGNIIIQGKVHNLIYKKDYDNLSTSTSTSTLLDWEDVNKDTARYSITVEEVYTTRIIPQTPQLSMWNRFYNNHLKVRVNNEI